MKFLANENFPFPSIRVLRDRGYDVKSIAEEMHGIPDSDVLRIAQHETRVILTFDRDYGELIFRHSLKSPPSVIYYRFKGAAPGYAGQILCHLLEEKEIDILGNFTVIEENSLRQRKYHKE